MAASEAQIAANRQNSLKSTGPRTEEGKAKCRANALKHGLCASVVLAEDVELAHYRELDWYEALKPQNAAQSWLVEKISIYSLRVDRCERMERRLRDRKCLISEVAWEDDQRLGAEILGGKIRQRPAQVAEELRRTPEGCDWLRRRWGMLAESIAVVGPWGPDQVALAFDLLGTPLEFRDGRQPTTPNDQSELCRREIEELDGRRELVTDLDQIDRALTEADLFDESHPELKRLRRYESNLHGRLRWCMSQFKYESPHLRPHPDFRPCRFKEEPEPESSNPETSPVLTGQFVAMAAGERRKDKRPWPRPFLDPKAIHPPFDLRPHEIPADGSRPEILKIAIGREVDRLEKAEDRRDARRRRLERRRA